MYNVVSGRYFNMAVAEVFFEELEAEKKRRAALVTLANAIQTPA